MFMNHATGLITMPKIAGKVYEIRSMSEEQDLEGRRLRGTTWYKQEIDTVKIRNMK